MLSMEKNTSTRAKSRAYLCLTMAIITLLPLTALAPNLPAVAGERQTWKPPWAWIARVWS